MIGYALDYEGRIERKSVSGVLTVKDAFAVAEGIIQEAFSYGRCDGMEQPVDVARRIAERDLDVCRPVEDIMRELLSQVEPLAELWPERPPPPPTSLQDRS